MDESVIVKGSRALLSMNQPGGFKCPSCAYPDPDCRQTLEFCENGAKALAHEATRFRVTRDLFERFTVSELAAQSDYWLERQGRLTEPMRYDAASDRYVPIGWDDAFALIGQHLRALDSPHQAEFYTSGRTPNEAAFLYAIFIRAFGTNNFPDCSDISHEPTSRGLPAAIGVGKGTVRMSDWDETQAIFVIGQNTGTNSPRMMTNLVDAHRRGVPIVAVNPMPERALIRFTPPQDVIEMATFASTQVASEFVHIRIGGDIALFKGMMKVLFERDAAGEAVIDRDFIEKHTTGMEAVRADALAQDWADLTRVSGLEEDQIRRCAEIYIRSNATMICYGMGLTQHQEGSRLLQQVCNLLFLRGNFGKPGAGIPPIRGHYDVHGDRAVGTDEKPSQAYLDRVQAEFGFDPPRANGHHTLEAIEAMMNGTAKVFVGMGGNFVRAIPDTGRSYAAMQQLDLTVAISTKLNRGHVIHGREALILPVISRSERIETAAGEQFVTIQESMAKVMASKGVLDPASPLCLSEVEIVCRMARAALPGSTTAWEDFAADFGLIRDKIARVYPEIYTDFAARIGDPEGFYLDVPPRRLVWPTANGKANFLVFDGIEANRPVDDPAMLRLATVRSHDQFNTTIYSNSDRYRGVYNNRMVVLMNEDDRKQRGFANKQLIALETISTDGITRRVDGLTVIDYPIAPGAVAGYYPELNPLLPLNYFDEISGTPAAKSIPVRAVTDSGLSPGATSNRG